MTLKKNFTMMTKNNKKKINEWNDINESEEKYYEIEETGFDEYNQEFTDNDS